MKKTYKKLGKAAVWIALFSVPMMMIGIAMQRISDSDVFKMMGAVGGFTALTLLLLFVIIALYSLLENLNEDEQE